MSNKSIKPNPIYIRQCRHGYGYSELKLGENEQDLSSSRSRLYRIVLGSSSSVSLPFISERDDTIVLVPKP